MNNDSTTPPEDATGVQDLIDTLKNDGVRQGRDEADQIVAEARTEAAEIIDQARDEAQKLVAEARTDAESLETNGKQALKLAVRDATLQMKEQLRQEFGKRLGSLVGQSLEDPKLIQQLIKEITSATVASSKGASDEQSSEVQLLLSAGSNPEAQKELDKLVRGLSGDMVSDGVQLQLVGAPESGIRVGIVDQDIEIDLTDAALTKWLMRFLAPRFRAIIEDTP